MNLLRRDSFLRCYCEAWVYWVAFNLLGALIGWLTETQIGVPTIPYSQLDLMFEPSSLVAQGVLIVPLFAAILVGCRRTTRAE